MFKKFKFFSVLILAIVLLVSQVPAAFAATGGTDYSTPKYQDSTGVNLYTGVIPATYFGDILYYDVTALTPAQINAVSNSSYFARGTVIVYKTDGSVVVGSAAETLCKTNQVKTMVIPGVGSSPYGTLAMAKQFSVIMNRPVAGLVAGVGGMTGVLTDGPEGYFLGRNSNIQKMSYDAFGKPGLTALDGGYAWQSLWNPYHWINNAFLNGETVGVGAYSFYVAYGARAEWYSTCGWQGIGAIWKSTASTTSQKLASLMEQGFKPEYVIGHSKGDMDAANAFYILKEKGKSSLYQGVKFVGFGMTVNVPSGIKAAQYLGTADALGSINSVRDSSTSASNNWIVMSGSLVSGKTHSLNQNSLIAPTHMLVPQIMQDVKTKLVW